MIWIRTLPRSSRSSSDTGIGGNAMRDAKYPYDLYASVLLLDGKIENWKVVNYPKKTPGAFSGFWKPARMKDYTVQNHKWTVNNSLEHEEVFSKHAPEWFRQ